MRIDRSFINNQNGWISGAGPNYYFPDEYPHLHLQTDGTQQTPKILWIKLTFGDRDVRNTDLVLRDNIFVFPYINIIRRPPADILEAMENQIQELNKQLVSN